jgi:hypothetical protein
MRLIGPLPVSDCASHSATAVVAPISYTDTSPGHAFGTVPRRTRPTTTVSGVEASGRVSLKRHDRRRGRRRPRPACPSDVAVGQLGVAADGTRASRGVGVGPAERLLGIDRGSRSSRMVRQPRLGCLADVVSVDVTHTAEMTERGEWPKPMPPPPRPLGAIRPRELTNNREWGCAHEPSSS